MINDAFLREVFRNMQDPLLLFAGSRNLIGEKNRLSRSADLSNICLISGMLNVS